MDNIFFDIERKTVRLTVPQFHRRKSLEKIAKAKTYADYVNQSDMTISEKDDCCRANKRQPIFDIASRVINRKKPPYTNKHWGK